MVCSNDNSCGDKWGILVVVVEDVYGDRGE